MGVTGLQDAVLTNVEPRRYAAVSLAALTRLSKNGCAAGNAAMNWLAAHNTTYSSRHVTSVSHVDQHRGVHAERTGTKTFSSFMSRIIAAVSLL
jgi:hypothetical protein